MTGKNWNKPEPDEIPALLAIMPLPEKTKKRRRPYRLEKPENVKSEIKTEVKPEVKSVTVKLKKVTVKLRRVTVS